MDVNARQTSRRSVALLLHAQLLVELRFEPEQRSFIVQGRAVHEEHVLGAIAEGGDLRA